VGGLAGGVSEGFKQGRIQLEFTQNVLSPKTDLALLIYFHRSKVWKFHGFCETLLQPRKTQMLKLKVCILVFEGFADWEPTPTLCEIRRSGKFEVLTAGFSDKLITTMGGLQVVPQSTQEELKPAEMAILILPGGDMWEQNPPDGFTSQID
jgi:hypothetical protein